MRAAAKQAAQVVHFPESALPGYAPKHLGPLEQYGWSRLEAYSLSIQELASSLGIWVILGSMRRAKSGPPANCTIIISKTGAIEAVYDKRHLYGAEEHHFSSGSSPCIVDIEGFKCGFLICYENCFPHLYREYRESGVELVFHSFYNAANSHPTTIQDLMYASLLVRAADNQLWISASNSSMSYSPLPACVVRPDGSTVRAKRNVTGLALDDFPSAELGWTYDTREFESRLEKDGRL